MGVHGLTTFLRERRSQLAKTLNFFQQDGPPTPLVVDGWSFIYKVLEDSGLPWVYGGEYDAFYDLVVKVVKAWITVGLRPIFVFDGSTPEVKLDTVIGRLNEAHVQQALLFFRTSSASRNTRRFLNEAFIIPPLALTVCVHALLDFQRRTAEAAQELSGEGGDVDQIEIHFADEEADPYAVELAGRLGAYVTGRDSDFVVFNSEGYLGYVPMEEMVWTASVSKDEQGASEDAEIDGFQSAKKKKRSGSKRMTGSGIIPPGSTDLSLSVSLYTPFSLAQHLSLPVSILPLLGALVGNDYTLQPGDRPSYAINPKAITRLLFERRLTNSQRITHASATLSTLLYGRPGKRNKKRPQSVMELIQMTVEALAVSSGAPSALVGPDQQSEMVEKIVEGTLPYAMPLRPSEDAFLSSTVCPLHVPHECRLVAQMDRAEMEGSSAYSETVSALYLRAYRLGKFSPSLMDILSTRTFWPDIFLENPDVETVSRSITRPLRLFVYSLLEDGMVIPAPAMLDGEEEEDSLDEDPEELIDVVEESDEYDFEDDISADVSKLRGELRQLQVNAEERVRSTSSVDQDSTQDIESVNGSVAPSSSMRSPAPLQRPTVARKRIAAQRKTVLEYIRRGARVVAEEIEVPSLRHFLSASADDDEFPTAIPIQLRAEEEHIVVLCSFLHTDPQRILGMSKDDRMPILAIRLVVRRLHERAEEAINSRERQFEKWTQKEARAFLASISRASVELALDPPSVVSERSIQLTAQILTALECIEHVVQVLLLTDAMPSCAHFFSGLRFHSLLALNEVADVPPNIWEAMIDGLDACFAEERVGKKARRKAQKAAAEPKIGSAVNGRGKMTGSGSLYSLLSDISA